MQSKRKNLNQNPTNNKAFAPLFQGPHGWRCREFMYEQRRPRKMSLHFNTEHSETSETHLIFTTVFTVFYGMAMTVCRSRLKYLKNYWTSGCVDLYTHSCSPEDESYWLWWSPDVSFSATMRLTWCHLSEMSWQLLNGFSWNLVQTFKYF